MKLSKKAVNVTAHSFDCLPAHVVISGKGDGASLRVALQRAVADVSYDQRLRHRRVGEFKLSVVVIR